MRDLLTGLAIILIVVLTTLLVAPYFVDWNGQRGFLEAQLSRAFGAPVTIGGDIDLKLLPTPYLRLNQTVIGRDDAAVRIGIRHLDLELSVAPLLHGEVDIVEGRLEQPVVRVALLPDRTLPVLPSLPATRLSVRLERVAIVDGTIAVTDAQSGRTFTADRIDGTVEASSLAGPYRGTGTQGEGRTKFRFSTTPEHPAAGATRTKLRFASDEGGGHPAFDLDGGVTLAAAGGRTVESFSGTVTANGKLRPTGRGAIGWRLAGPLRADAAGVSFGGGELRLGSGDNALAFAAQARLALDGAPQAQATLVARQLDIDRLAGPPAADGTAAPTPRLPDLASLRDLAAAAAPSVPVAIDASVETAIWAGQPLSGIEARLTLGAATPQPVHLAGEGPGGLRVALDDEPGAAAGGRIDLAAADLPAALAWMRAVAPEGVLPAGIPPVRQASLVGRFALQDHTLAIEGLTLALDRSTLHGSTRLQWPDRAEAPIAVAATLATKLLDLDSLPPLPAPAPAAGPGGVMPPALDVALTLDADAVKIAQAGSGPLDAGRLHLEGQRSPGRLAVSRLDVNDLGGATLRGRGEIADAAASLDLDVDAARVDAASALLAQLAPGRAADALVHRAASLAPAKLHLAARFDRGGRDRLATSRLDLAGSFAATALDVHLAPEGDGMRLRATAETPRGEGLLRQVGLPFASDAASPGARLGAAKLTLDGAGPLDGAMRTRVEATFGGSHLGVDGTFQLFGAGRGGSGALTLASPDALPLLRSLGLASADARNLLPLSLSGGLALGQTGVAVSDLKGSVAGGGVAGTLRWRSIDGTAPGAPALTGALDLDRLALGDITALLLGPPRATTGAGWSNEPFAAGLADMPRGLMTLRAKTLDLGRSFGPAARDATLEIETAPGSLALKRLAAGFAGGGIEAEGTMRRDGQQATLAGALRLHDVVLDIPAMRAKVTGKLGFAGGGATPLALIASLAGSGESVLQGTVLPGFDPQALPRVFTDAETDALAVDAESVKRAFASANAAQPGRSAVGLDLGTLRAAVSLASGRLAIGQQAEPTRIGAITAAAGGAYDLQHANGELSVTETLRELPRDWSGDPPSLTVTLAGLPGEARRSLEVGDFINAVAARAIARETARIETFEFDVKERALFNARLIFDRRREQDRLKAEADAKAAAEATRQETARQEAARDAERRAGADGGAGAAEGSPTRLPQPVGPPPSLPQAAPLDPSTAGRY